jgi:hypothetical protein
MQVDFAKLQQIARSSRSNDATPFPAEVFDAARKPPKPWWKLS